MQYKRDALDAAKGILILCIVIGHNSVLLNAYPWIDQFFYNWHVYGFFLISMMLPFNSTRQNFLIDRLTRYLVPFLVFLFVAYVVHQIATHGQNFPRSLLLMPVAAITGSADLLDSTSGARLFWFLPTLAGLTFIRYVIYRSNRFHKPLMYFVSITGFLFIGLIPRELANFFPLGLPIALYLLLPGLMFRYVMSKFRGIGGFWVGLGCALFVFIAMNYVAAASGTALTLASFEFYDITAPLALVNHAVLAISACCIVVFAASLAPRVPVLAWLGRESLFIYLIHQFAFIAFRGVMTTLLPDFVHMHRVLAGILLLVVTLAASSLVALAITQQQWLKELVAPNGWNEWKVAVWRLAKRDRIWSGG